MTKQELQERLNKLAAEIRAAGEKFNAQEKRWKDAEEKASWEKLNREYDETRAKLDAVLEAEAVDARMNSVRSGQEESRNLDLGIPGTEDHRGDGRNEDRRNQPQGPTDEQRALALAGFFRAQLGMGLSDRDVEAMRACRMHPGQRELLFRSAPTELVRRWQRQVRSQRFEHAADIAFDERGAAFEFERRAMGTYQLSAGGSLVPTSFIRSLEINMLAFGGMRQVAETLITPTGEDMYWPTVDDSSNEGTQIGENESVGTNTQPTTAAVKWGAYKFSSKPVLVDYSLLQDAPFDLPTILGQMLGERLGRATNRKYTTGTGAATPKGLLQAAESGVTAAANAIAYDDIIKLEHAVDPAYRAQGSYMMHDTILLAARLLKDSDGRYLWMNGADVGKPDTLSGRPLTINQHMDSTTTTGKKPIAFGDISRYKIRRVSEIRLYRLEERYRDTDQDGFIAIVREDGNLLNAGTCPVKYLTMP